MPSKMSYVLAIDSAVNGCGVCVYNVAAPDQSVEMLTKMSRGQAEALVPKIQEAVLKAGIGFQDIDLVATTIGPGTFTGLRVGISAAKSFALALSRPLHGFSTLEVIAQGYFNQHPHPEGALCVLLETKRSDYYCQIWDGAIDKEVIAPSALGYKDILALIGGRETVIIGDAGARFHHEAGNHSDNKIVGGYDQPNPSVLAEMAISSNKKAGAVEPLYLRGADVSEPKTPPRKIMNEINV